MALIAAFDLKYTDRREDEAVACVELRLYYDLAWQVKNYPARKQIDFQACKLLPLDWHKSIVRERSTNACLFINGEGLPSAKTGDPMYVSIR